MTKAEQNRNLLEENRDILLNGESNNGLCFDGLVDEIIYDKQKIKVAVLLKETNGDDYAGNEVEQLDDFEYTDWLKKQQVNNEPEIRRKGEKVYLEENVFYYSTFRKLCYWLSLLFDILEDKKIDTEKYMPNGKVDIAVVRKVLNNVAVLNLKKSWGKKQTDDNLLSQYVSNEDIADVLRKQMDIFSPHIILCCSPAVFELAQQVYKTNNSFLYSETSKTIQGKNIEFAKMDERIFISFYHPQYYGKSDEVFSNYAIETFEHLQKYLKNNM